MGKHAYLISVHNKPSQLRKLIETLDDSRNDIFIHIDLKAENIYDEETIQKIISSAKMSEVVFIKDRISVEWGQYSLSDVKIRLLKAARKKGTYQYYHNISGQDFPIKSQEYIHDFFDENNGKEFISFEKPGKHNYSYRYKYYYSFLKDIGRPKNKLDKFKIVAYAKMQGVMFGIDRAKNNSNILFKKGGGWFSITDRCAQYVISKEAWIKETFEFTFCSDEMFLQTLLWNSTFRDSLYIPNNGETETMRLIDWNRGHPYTYRISDFRELQNSKCLWARKFDEDVDDEIITRLEEQLSEGERRT